MKDEEWDRIAEMGGDANTDREWFEMATAELRAERDRLRDGIAAHRRVSEHYRRILWDGEIVSDLPHNEALWLLLDGVW